MHWLSRIPLKGKDVTLEPLNESHIEGLQAAVKETAAEKLWFAKVPAAEDMTTYVTKAIAQSATGGLGYAVRLNTSGKIVGTTRFYDVESANKRVRLGYTWYTTSVRRTSVNTETKYLLLKHLFETHDAIAVEFQTHFFNHASRAAIERLGAKQDGILRNHQILDDGTIRDTVVYSILNNEWPVVKNNLLSKLG